MNPRRGRSRGSELPAFHPARAAQPIPCGVLRPSTLALSLLAACNAPAAPPTPIAAAPATPTPIAATPPALVPTTPPTAPAPVTVTAPTDTTATTRPPPSFDRAAVRQHLDAGRAKVRAGDHAGAITDFAAVLALYPAHPKALGELGWAAFLAGDLERADRSTRAAIGVTAPARTGALLYNLGRILEQRDQPDLALTAYQRSLAVRPGNKVVAARVAALTPTTTAAPLGADYCGFTARTGPPPADLCAGYIAAEKLVDYRCLLGRAPVRSADTRDANEIHVQDLAVADGVRVTALTIEHPEVDITFAATVVVLVVVVGDRWWTGTLGEVAHVGLSHLDADLYVDSLEARDVLDGAPPELLVRLTTTSAIGDEAIDPPVGEPVFWEYSEQDLLGVLSLAGAAPRWLAAIHTRQRDRVEVTGIGPDDRWLPHTLKSRTERRADVQFSAGEVEVKLDAPSTSPALGRFKLGAYPTLCPGDELGRPAFREPDPQP